jgi:threonine dehydrogenase-like Zn-dependent dehydrogenase
MSEEPSLHDVATGTIDMQEGLSYTMLAHRNHFKFVFGALHSIDLAHRTIVVAAMEEEARQVVIHECMLPGSRLRMGVAGTTRNDLVKQSRLAFNFGNFWFKGRKIVISHANVKHYNYNLAKLIQAGNAKPSQIISY